MRLPQGCSCAKQPGISTVLKGPALTGWGASSPTWGWHSRPPKKHPDDIYRLSQIDRSCQIRKETNLAFPPLAKRARPSLLGIGKI